MFHNVSCLLGCLPELSNDENQQRKISYALSRHDYFNVLTNIELFASILTRTHACANNAQRAKNLFSLSHCPRTLCLRRSGLSNAGQKECQKQYWNSAFLYKKCDFLRILVTIWNKLGEFGRCTDPWSVHAAHASFSSCNPAQNKLIIN